MLVFMGMIDVVTVRPELGEVCPQEAPIPAAALRIRRQINKILRIGTVLYSRRYTVLYWYGQHCPTSTQPR